MSTATLPQGFSAVLHKPTQLVLQRHHSTAREMASAHPDTFELVRDDRPTINQVLATMTTAELVHHARRHNLAAFTTTSHPELVARLATEVENGTLPLPTQEIL